MPSSRPFQSQFGWIAAGLTVVIALLGVVGWWATEGSAASAQPAAAPDEVASEAPTTTTIAAAPTASTAAAAADAAAEAAAATAAVPSSPPTTRERPVPATVPAVRTTVVAPVVAEPPAPSVVGSGSSVAPPAPASASATDRCAAARQWVDGQGLVLPAGYGFRCPGAAVMGETPRWGVTCWNCAPGSGNYIAVDIDRIGPSDATLRYVVAHETCHAIDFALTGISTEIGADLCAALHGAPRP
ncbi:MAG: hypothetical protein QOH36_1749 [Actinomycetota bacterium]|nr:hypothetical protein [Actinomycetota bacterium]